MLLKAFLLLGCVVAALAQGARRDQRIYSGVEVALGEFPWQVSLQYARCGIPFCSGVILDEYTILTAAHCSTGSRPQQVVSRTRDISVEGVGNGTRSRVVEITKHEDFDELTMFHNIALWKLTPFEPIELDGVHAAAIKLLPQGTRVLAGTPTQVAGWGYTNPGGTTSDVLLKADVPIIEYQTCQRIYKGKLLPNEICAGTEANLMDACEGDDGAPLVYNGTLIGIATWGNTCGGFGQPGIYTNAAKYTDWIKNNSGVGPTAK